MSFNLKKKIEFLFLFFIIFIIFTPFEAKEYKWFFLINYVLVALLIFINYILSKNVIKIKPSMLVIIIIIILLFSAFSIWTDKASVTALYLLCLTLILSFILFIYAKNNIKLLVSVLNFYIILSVACLIFQLLYFYVSGDIFSFHSLIFPFSEDRGSVLSNINLARFTGFHNESGTYGTWLSFTILALIILEKRPNLVAYIGTFSLLLTLSGSSIVYFFIIVIAIFFERLKSIDFSKIVIGIVIFISLFYIVFFHFGFYDYFENRFFDNTSSDGTTALKLMAFEHLKNSDSIRIIMGSGFNINDCSSCTSLQDTGLGFNLFFYLGFFSFFIIYLIQRLARPNQIYHWVAMLVLLISKAFIYSYAFWILIFIIRLSRDIETDSKSKF